MAARAARMPTRPSSWEAAPSELPVSDAAPPEAVPLPVSEDVSVDVAVLSVAEESVDEAPDSEVPDPEAPDAVSVDPELSPEAVEVPVVEPAELVSGTPPPAAPPESRDVHRGSSVSNDDSSGHCDSADWSSLLLAEYHELRLEL